MNEGAKSVVEKVLDVEAPAGATISHAIVFLEWTRTEFESVTLWNGEIVTPDVARAIRIPIAEGGWRPDSKSLDLRLRYSGSEPAIFASFHLTDYGWQRIASNGARQAVDESVVMETREARRLAVLLQKRYDMIAKGDCFDAETSLYHRFFFALDVNTRQDFRNVALVQVPEFQVPCLDADFDELQNVKHNLQYGVVGRVRDDCLFSFTYLKSISSVFTLVDHLLKLFFMDDKSVFQTDCMVTAFLRFANGQLALRNLDVNLSLHAEPDSAYFLLFAELALAAPELAPNESRSWWASVAPGLIAAQEVFEYSYYGELETRSPCDVAVGDVALNKIRRPYRTMSSSRIGKILKEVMALDTSKLLRRFSATAHRVLFEVPRPGS